MAFLTHAYNTYPICCACEPKSSGIVDRGLVLLRVSRPFVSLFIYEITTPWTKSIREKEKIYLRFFYGLREDKMIEETVSGPWRTVRRCHSQDCRCKQGEEQTFNFACR